MSTLSWLRIAGTHAPAHEVLARAAGTLAVHDVRSAVSAAVLDDYAQVDPTLASGIASDDVPQPATGYAGFAPAQRGAYQQWASAPGNNAPLAFRQLYAANLETWLIEEFTESANRKPALLRAHLAALLESPAWRADDLLPRILLLAGWLHNDGKTLQSLVSTRLLSPSLLGTALGMQALLPDPTALSADQALVLAHAYRIETHGVEQQLLALRLSYLAEQLQAEPLQHALAHSLPDQAPHPESETAPDLLSQIIKPWRTNHRDLRLGLPQPDLRPVLEPMLATLFTQTDFALAGIVASTPTPLAPAAPPAPPAPERVGARNRRTTKAPADRKEWSLVLEFGESRSQYYSLALELAQREANYQPLLDERREIIHRVHFRKHEMRRFWRLWDFVQTWSNSRVYVNGNELEKWQIWPWSQYLR